MRVSSTVWMRKGAASVMTEEAEVSAFSPPPPPEYLEREDGFSREKGEKKKEKNC